MGRNELRLSVSNDGLFRRQTPGGGDFQRFLSRTYSILRKMNELRQYLGKTSDKVNFQRFLVRTYDKLVQYLGKFLS